jgi:hypothetical protein
MADLILVDDRLGLIRPFIDTRIIHQIVAAALEGPPIGGEKRVGHLRLILELLKPELLGAPRRLSPGIFAPGAIPALHPHRCVLGSDGP